MKLIARDVDYALRALCFIVKEKKKIISVSELAGHLKVPQPFLRKLLQVLNKKGVLSSHKGKGGGFILAKAPGRIFLVDLIEIFHGPLQLNECLLKKMTCPNVKTCPLRKKIDKIEDYVLRQLRSISVNSLLR